VGLGKQGGTRQDEKKGELLALKLGYADGILHVGSGKNEKGRR